MKSQDYFIKREKAWQEQQIADDKTRMAEIKKRMQYAQDAIQKEINAQWDSFSNGQRITRSEAMKRASEMDVKAFARKAKKYVKEKDFSPTANKELKLYNLTMRVNRLELLKANIGLELIATFNDMDKYFSGELTSAGLKELQRQAGILDMTISKSDYGKRVEQVLNSSFKAEGFATFSDNLWMYQAELKAELDKLLVRSVTMGRNPKQLAPELAKYLTQEGKENAKFNAQRLMVTETTRVQTGIQKQSYLDMEFEEFVFISEPTACRICLPLNNKTFRVDDMSPGVNCAPMHPFCRCSTAPYVERMNDKRAASTQSPQNDIDSIISNLDSTNMKERVGKENYEAFIENLKTIEDPRIAAMYAKYGNEIEFGKIKDGRSYATDNFVQLSPSAFKSTHIGKAFETVYHENAHAFDAVGIEKIIGESQMKVGTTKTKVFGKTVEIDEYVRRASSLPQYKLKETIQKDLWKHVNGDLPRFEDIGSRPRKKAEKAAYDELSSKIFAESQTNFRKFNDKLNEASKKNPSAYASLSDISEGTGYVTRFGSGGHEQSYWKKNGTLETEFFAEVTASRAVNPEAYNQLKEVYPNAVKVWEQITDDILKGGG